MSQVALEIEIGSRAFQYLDIENSAWAYKFWWMSGKWWWDAKTQSWVKETREYFLDHAWSK